LEIKSGNGMSKNKKYVPGADYEFHIAGSIRNKYGLTGLLFGNDGRVIFANFRAVREFVFHINKHREAAEHLYPGEVNAAGLLDEVFHLLLRRYEEQVNPGVFSRLREQLMESSSAPAFRALLLDFVKQFPPQDVYLNKVGAREYLAGFANGRPHLEIAIEEAMMLYFSNINPANRKLRVFFDKNYLGDPAAFKSFIDALELFFLKEPPFGPRQHDLFALLKAPMEAAPDDLNAQLEYILEHWKEILPESITLKVLHGQDLMKEDVRLEGGPGGEPPTIAPRYKNTPEGAEGFTIGKSAFKYVLEVAKDYEEYEHFTDDTHWMPRVVMLAKNTYVWLDQLSKKYHREIRRLDQVPDEELDQLAKWHINGLWLIGVWERSSASKRIKHIMGNIDAVSSAYSLYDYDIAADLGGEAAFENLNQRARACGIRLAGDMVPNHTGIFSRWIKEHPDYFIQASHPPFPGYRFTGENLSEDPAIQIRLEDGYYSKQDAAVVFQRVDNHSGEVRYIYHGNDGTMMPWNDTAQLDFLKKEVREAVMQKIIDVARRFSIIRFDAAMTLAKKHFARLWYPRPGTGGDIASRADYAMPQAAFDEMFPVEFWREVVDRMNREMPETLLLAEAFWFMEGYFVRTLGMHRVYNSAFMHMLKNEENAKYRDLITNTLEFEPEILKRYVNFMSNPDEETAIRQFGTGDKYFGICVLMTTLPGLPMFGHGQIEGYTEKYGMEYQRAYYNEPANQWLVEKHEREIFPLTARRHIFSEVEHFSFFDFIDDGGHLNENVMAYTNRHNQEKALVLFNNKYEAASGHIFHSAPKLEKSTGNTRTLTLGEALAINPGDKMFYIFREHISGLEYLRSGKEFHSRGFHWKLNGFEYRVFMDFREIHDTDGTMEALHAHLQGQGVFSMEQALAEMQLKPVHTAFEGIFEDACIQRLVERIINREPIGADDHDFGPVEAHFKRFLNSLKQHRTKDFNLLQAEVAFKASLEAMESAAEYLDISERSIKAFLKKQEIASVETILVAGSKNIYRENMFVLLAHITCKALHASKHDNTKPGLHETLQLQWPLKRILAKTGRGPNGIARDATLVQLLSIPTSREIFNFLPVMDAPADGMPPDHKLPALTRENTKKLLDLLEQPLVKDYLGVNQHQGLWYFSKEHFEELLQWLFSLTFFEFFNEHGDMYVKGNGKALQNLLQVALKFFIHLKKASENAGYKAEALRETILEWQ
jgi:glycosidase